MKKKINIHVNKRRVAWGAQCHVVQCSFCKKTLSILSTYIHLPGSPQPSELQRSLWQQCVHACVCSSPSAEVRGTLLAFCL